MESTKNTFENIIQLPSWAIHRSAMQEALLSDETGYDPISLGLGVPDPHLLPLAQLAVSAEAVLHHSSVLQYNAPCAALREHIVSIMNYRGVNCAEDQVFLTSGAQQGLLLLCRLLLSPGDSVATDEVTYPGLRQAVESCGARLVPIPVQTGLGPDLDSMRSIFSGSPKPAFYYTVPEGHNPLGLSFDSVLRERICQLADEFRMPIVEDDAYGLLTYGEIQPAPLKALQPERTFYVGSFSKVIAPSLRIGWLVAPQYFTSALAIAKESADINCATLSQYLVADYLASDMFLPQICRIRNNYMERRDTMMRSLELELPGKLICSHPHSGVFVWVELRDLTDSDALASVALKCGVSVFSGSSFSVCPSAYSKRCLRLNFSSNPPERIRLGIKGLASAVNRMLELS